MADKATRNSKTPSPTRSAKAAPGEKPKSEYTVRSLERGLTILKCFDVDHPGRTLSELTELTGLHKATCFRLVKTLEDQDFLSFSEPAGRYYLGTSLLRISALARSHDELSRLARPHLEQLARETGETVDLAVWTSDGILFLDQVLTSHPFKPVSSAGRVFTDLRNAHAKVLVAFGPENRLEQLLARQDFDPENGYTRDAIEESLAEVRRTGVAWDLEERSPGICAVAVPVCAGDQSLIASLAVVAPSERFGPAERETYAEALRRRADALCLALPAGTVYAHS
ncbi:MAG: hypothetical protein Kow00129_04910 [Thermoleophilia bacterium]